MFKLLEKIDNFTKSIAENLERKVSRSTFIKTSMSTLFLSIMGLATTKSVFAADISWCETWYPPETGCTFPNGGRVCSGCSSSQSTKCPTGHTSYKYWYPTTGCWCVNYSWGAMTCCDCMPNGKSGNSNACGCATILR
ncbi:hypothetical protein EKG37_17625 [Robertmurraya yapensis]|uniref:Uncharacterized protein n=2 Tax=Bacillaceae TaxID=186817 RepID=A0A431VXZ9_9BACI|nr:MULTISPECIES: hypothetical protein [Bacillaceae]RTR28121.1 hypothetical protein EKG37_17625 [Bacillus yapensis]TKC15157.1 hypothetical protein FA727_19940 [Robertmurraya kyonggiensis]TKS94364.1 hypothetical protein FAR12_17630 [Bacillus yapensis]